MSRDDGFPIADVDVGILRDVKVRRLRRHVPDDVPATTLLYLAVLLSSWEEGYRLAVEEADSPVPATPERVAALRATGLLDDECKVPVHAWESWFRPAWERRNKKRTGGLEGNRRRWHPDHPPVTDLSVSESVSESDPDSPSVQSVPTDPSVRPSRANGKSNRRTTETTIGACIVCAKVCDDGQPGVRMTPDGLVHELCRDAYHAGAVA